MPQEWTEGRLDDLNAKVDRGFEHADSEARALRLEMRAEFAELRGEMKAGFARFDQRLERLDGSLDDIQKTMVQAMVAITGGILAGFSGIIVLIATQL